jgi:hypothetical protein
MKKKILNVKRDKKNTAEKIRKGEIKKRRKIAQKRRREKAFAAALSMFSLMNKIMELPDEFLLYLVDKYYPNLRNTKYDPITTLKMFIRQFLGENQSCSRAVTEENAELREKNAANDLNCTNSPDTSGYVKARQRLSIELVKEVFDFLVRKHTEKHGALDIERKSGRVFVIDGSTLLLADTPANQAEFPQHSEQAEGAGSPIIRVTVLFCLETRSVVDYEIAPYKGKNTGEITLGIELLKNINQGDLLLGDALYAKYSFMSECLHRGINVLFHHNKISDIDFRTGKKLGENDHVIAIKKPSNRPDYISEETWNVFPEKIKIRETKCVYTRADGSVETHVLVTTLGCNYEKSMELINSDGCLLFSSEVLISLYKRRWDAELSFRELKHEMKIGIINCKSPKMALKYIMVGFISFNMIRLHAVNVSIQVEIKVSSVSFKKTKETLFVNRRVLHNAKDPDQFCRIYVSILDEIGGQVVGNRPDRIEPRAIKMRPKSYQKLKIPREQAIAQAKMRYKKDRDVNGQKMSKAA